MDDEEGKDGAEPGALCDVALTELAVMSLSQPKCK